MDDYEVFTVKIKVTRRGLQTLASKSQVLRIEPRKRWTIKEQKEHARYTIEHLIVSIVGENEIARKELED